ncbi:MAG: 50S ribosomal protein L21 [Microgenomates group bacterium]
MSKFAVIKIGGFQYKVAEGEEIEVDKIEGEKGESLTFNEVLLVANGEKIEIGRPRVENAKVEADIVGQFKGEKIRVATYKAKTGYRRVKGFRPLLTKLKIKKISS